MVFERPSCNSINPLSAPIEKREMDVVASFRRMKSRRGRSFERAWCTDVHSSALAMAAEKNWRKGVGLTMPDGRIRHSPDR